MNFVATTTNSETVIFPLLIGRMEQDKFKRMAFAGTGFFISTQCLAVTAAHGLEAAEPDQMVVASLSNTRKPMNAYPIKWSVRLPESDIAVMRVDVPGSPCFRTHFSEFMLNQEVRTTGIAEHMLETDSTGKTEIFKRSARGYVAYGRRKWVAANFALPAGMSGSPAVVTKADVDYVAGVLVGQIRSEIVEDFLSDVTETTATGKSVYVEKISRVEYMSRIDVLAHHGDHIAAEFGGTLAELIARETREP